MPSEQKLVTKGTKNIRCDVKDIDEKQGIVSIYVNAFGNLDADRDISMPGSFDKTIKENFKRIAHLQNHDRYIRLGWPKEFIPDSYGLLTISAMNMDKQVAKDQFSDYLFAIKMGRSLEHSIGYEVIKCNVENPEDWKIRIRRITEYKLYEYSTLSFLGANELSTTVDAKHDSIVSLQEEFKLLDEMLHFGDYSDEKYIKLEKKLNEIKNKIIELKTLNTNEPLEDTQGNKPNLIEKSKINYIEIINNLKIK